MRTKQTESCLNGSLNGLTFVEVLVLILGVVALFAGLAILILGQTPKGRASRPNCYINVKQIGLGMRMWANDHGDRFPWSVSTNEGGTMEYANTTEVFRHYLAVSNELTSPKLLACGGDYGRARATYWSQLTNSKAHLSYFIGLDADESRPQMILSGDRNLTVNGTLTSGLVTLRTNSVMGVAPLMHTNFVNVGLADGSAQQVVATGLQKLNGVQFASITNQSVRLAIP